MTDKKSPKKVVDVSHPDDVEPSATSKPIIVSNRPILKDPMVTVDESAGKEEVVTEKDADKHHSEEHIIEVKKSAPNGPTASENAEDIPKESEPEHVKNDENVDETVADAEEETEILDDNGNEIKDPNELDKEKAEANKLEAELQKLVDSKEYNLPINSVEKRRTHRTVIIGLVLSVVLGLAWVNVALDAEIINLGGIKALTNFF